MFVQVLESNGTITMELPGKNVRFHMPAIAEADACCYSAKYFDDAATALGALISISDEINKDPELSQLGKVKRLEPKQASLIETIANRWDAINQQEAQIVARENELFAVPKLDATHSAMAVEDREIRDYLRSIGEPLAISHLNDVSNQRLQIAILRSPLPQSEQIKSLTLDAWKEGRRLENPAEAVAIDSERIGIEWSRRGLAQVAGISRSFLSGAWTNDRMLRQVIVSGNEFTRRGYGAWGFGGLDVARVERALAHESKQRY